MHQSAGTLTINGKSTPLEYAECSLYVGYLEVGFAFYSIREGGGDLSRLPIGKVVDYAMLDGRSVELVSNDPLFKDKETHWPPNFSINAQFYEVTSVAIEPMRYIAEDKSLSIRAQFTASEVDDQTKIEGRLDVEATCIEIDRNSVLRSPSPIPLWFVNHYFSIIGLPVLPDNAMREDVVRLFGAPYRQGEGVHPKYGSLTDWTIYQLPEHYMRFQFDCDRVTQVTFMPKEGPFALKI